MNEIILKCKAGFTSEKYEKGAGEVGSGRDINNAGAAKSSCSFGASSKRNLTGRSFAQIWSLTPKVADIIIIGRVMKLNFSRKNV